MPFRLIKNRMQDIAVKGAIVTLALSLLLAVFKILEIDLTLPFLLLWAMLWLIGEGVKPKSGNEA